MLRGIAAEQCSGQLHKGGNMGRLKRVCSEFESIFLTYMLKSMRKTIVADGLIGNSHDGKIINSMFDENLALGIARGGGIGIGKALFEHLHTPAAAPSVEYSEKDFTLSP